MEAHHLTPDDAATLRRRVPRTRMGTTTAVVVLVVSAYAIATADDGWYAGAASAAGFLLMGVGAAALVLAYPAPRTAAACGAVWTAFIGYSALVPHGDVVIAPGGVSAAIALSGTAVLVGACWFGAQITARRRALLETLRRSGQVVPHLDPATRAGLVRTRAVRTGLGAVALAVAAGFAVLTAGEVARTSAAISRARTTVTTVEHVDESGDAYVVIDGHRYALGPIDAGVGDTVQVRYDTETGYAEDVDDPRKTGGFAVVVGIAAPLAAWLLGTETMRRRSVRHLLTSGGAPLTALVARSSATLLVSADGDVAHPIGTWERVSPIPARLGPHAGHGRPDFGPEPDFGPDDEAARFAPALVVAAEPDLDVLAIRADGEDTWLAWTMSPSHTEIAEISPDGTVADPRPQSSCARHHQRVLQRAERNRAQTATMRRTGASLSWLVPAGMLLVSTLATWGQAADRLVLVIPALYVGYRWAWLGSPSLSIGERGLRVHGRFVARTFPWNRVAKVEAWQNALLIHTLPAQHHPQVDPTPIVVPYGSHLPPLLTGDPDPNAAAARVDQARTLARPLHGTMMTAGPARPALVVAATVVCTVAGSLVGLLIG